jgi:hypothetical protein
MVGIVIPLVVLQIRRDDLRFLTTRIMDCASVLALLTVADKSLLYRPLTCASEVASVGIALVTKAHVVPAVEKFGEILRQLTGRKFAHQK